MRSFAVWRNVTLAAVLLLVCGVATQLWRDIESTRTAAWWVEHTYQVLNTAESLLSAVQRAETGQRGYLLTGDANFLEPYRSALAAEQSLRARLATLVVDDPAQAARVKEINRAVSQRLAFLSKTVDAHQPADRAAALAAVRTGEGERLMAHVRNVIHQMEVEQQRLLADRTADARSREVGLRWSLIIGFVSVLILLAVAGASAERFVRSRERAERALRDSEERVRRVLDNLPDVIALYDGNRRIQYVNSATTAITGMTPAQFAGRREDELFPPEVSSQVVSLLDTVLESRTAQSREVDLILPGTGPRHLLLRCLPLLDDAGAVRELIGITHDLTDWKRAQDALRLQAETEFHILQTMVAAAPVGLVMLDRNLRQTQASQRWLDDVGLTRDQAIGKPHYECFPDLPEVWKTAHRRGLAGESLGGREECFMAPDGTEHWVNWEIRPWGDSGEITGGIIIYSEDITQRKLTEQDAVQSGMRYRALFEHMNEGLAYCEMIFEDGVPRDFVYLATNEAFGNLTGLPDVVGKRVSEVVPGILEADPELIRTYGRVASSGMPEKFEVWVEALQMWFSISAYSPERNFFVAVFDVITERKESGVGRAGMAPRLRAGRNRNCAGETG